MGECRLLVGFLLLIASTAYAACPANSTDPKCRAEQQQAQQRAQQAAQQKAQQAAQQATQQKAQQAAQQATQQKAQQAAQQAAQQKAQQDAARQSAQQRPVRDAAKQSAQQRPPQDAAKQSAQQRLPQDAAKQSAQHRPPQDAAKQSAQHRLPPDAAKQSAQQRPPQDAAKQSAQQRPPLDAAKQSAQQRSPPDAAKQSAQLRPTQDAAKQSAQHRPPQDAAKQSVQQRAAQPNAAPAQPGVRQPVSSQAQQPSQSGRQPLQNQTQATRQSQAPAFAAPHRQFNAPAGQASTPAIAKPIAVNAATTVVPHANRSGYTVDRRNKDGSKLVVSQTVRPNGTRGVVAYKQIEDRRSGASTRIYTDGHRETVGRTFVSRATHNGPNFVRYNNGLRAATLPNGRPIYREKFATVTGPDGRARQIVQRTALSTVVRGRYVPLRTPVVQVYDVVPVYRRPMYVYRPAVYAALYFAPFYSPFSARIEVGPDCSICPPPAAMFEQPMQSYADPMDLMGDLQIAGALSDSGAWVPDMSQPDESAYPTQQEGYFAQPDLAELADLRNQAEELEQQVAAQANDNAELQATLAEARLAGTRSSAQDKMAGVPTKIGNEAPVQIPEYARQQIRKQVRLNVAQHQNQHPLLLSNIVESGYAKIYIFQASTPLDVFDVRTAEQCTLSGGDLIGFFQVPRENTQESDLLEVGQMKVIASRPGDCLANQVVEVNLADLQEMLNAFSQRVENNMKSLNLCSASPNACRG